MKDSSAAAGSERPPKSVELVGNREPTPDEIKRGLELEPLAQECLARNKSAAAGSEREAFDSFQRAEDVFSVRASREPNEPDIDRLQKEAFMEGVKHAERLQKACREQEISIRVFQQDWIPGFAAFNDDGCINETAKAHVILNLGAFMAAIQTKHLDPKDLPYFVAESLMHEVIHVLEAWANVEFSEDRVEALLTKYREKYERATIWEYTGGAPHSEAVADSGANAQEEKNETFRTNR